MKGTSDIGSVL
jgi:hypothetical protein